MATFITPRSDAKRHSFIFKSANTSQLDFTGGRIYLDEPLRAHLNDFAPVYKEKYSVVTGNLSAREKEIREKNISISVVQTYTTDMWEVLRRRANRLNQPAEVLTFYQLGLDGKNPTITTDSGWIDIAEKVVEGDAQAVEAGYTAMVNPSAAELNEVITAAKKELAEVVAADRNLDKAEETLAASRIEADEIISEVMAQLRYNLRKLDGPSQRRIMRSYGAEFKYLPGEPAEEEETEAPAAP